MLPPASDDAVLLEHLQLANQQLTAVLADAGCSLPELPLPADAQQLQEEEVMALLAEENYQLRQLWQRLQQQQQLEELEQQLVLQHELEMSRGALEFDRLSPSPEQQADCTPVAAAGPGPGGALFGSPAALDTTRGWLSPAHAAAGSAMSPAAARIVHAPSLNTVQLVEAEAAAQLATQAVIQAEAEAYHHMPWQQLQPLQDSAGCGNAAEYSRHAHTFSAHSTDHSPVGSCSFDDMHQQIDNRQQEQDQLAHLSNTGSSRMALPQLPQLSLPRHLIARRSQESTCSDVGRSSVASAASGDLTWRSHATPSTSRQPPSATAAAASARSNASSSCSGLKQLANDLLLLPPDLQVYVPGTGLEASQQTFGPGHQDTFSGHGRPMVAGLQSPGFEQRGAREGGVDQGHKAAGLAADAAAGIWYSGSARGGSAATSGLALSGNRAASGAADAVRAAQGLGDSAARAGQQADATKDVILQRRGSAFAAAATTAAEHGDVFTQDQWHLQQDWQRARGQQQQQQPQTGNVLQPHMPLLPPISTSTRRSGSWGLPPTSPAQPSSSAVSQAAAAATALASQAFWQHQQLPPPPQQPLPALRLPARVQTFAQQQSPPQQQQQQPLPALQLPPTVQTFAQQQSPPQQQQQPMPALRLPPRVQSLAQAQQQHGSPSSSEGEEQSPDIPPSLPRLRLPGQQHAAQGTAAGNAAAAAATAQQADSYSSSPEDSPLSDSAFFRAAGAGLFDGSSNGLLDAGADLFGARISMDDSGLGLSCSEAQPSQLPDVPEDYFGLPDSSDNADGPAGSSYCMSQQGGWLGVSYQSQQYLRAAQHRGLSSGHSSREQQLLYGAAAGTSADTGSSGGFQRRRSMGQSVVAGTIDELSELVDADFSDMTLSRHDIRGSTCSGSGFVATAAAGSMSSLASGATSQQVSFTANVSRQPSAAAHAAGGQQQHQDQLPAFPNLAPLRVVTGRQQEQTPPMTWQPQPLRTDSSSSARSTLNRTPSATATAAAVAAATSPAHMAATVAAEAAASVGLAAAATGGLDSQQLQQLLHHLARVAEEASSNVTAAAAAAAVTPGRAGSAPAGPAAVSPAAAVGPRPVARVQEPTLGSPQCQQQQQQQEQHAQPEAAAVDDADCFTPVARASDTQQQQQQVLSSGQPCVALSPFAAAGVHSPARPAASSCLVMSPQPPALLRTLSAGQMADGGAAAGAAGLPPKWASRSSSNTNLAALQVQVPSPQRSLQQQRQQQLQDDLAGQSDQQQQQQQQSCAATAVPCAAAPPAAAAPERAAAAPAGPTSMASPRLGLHGRLRVITHAGAGAGGYSSNGSNSDADPGSAHTTPMHRPSHQGGAGLAVRAGSGTSLSRPAGLTSITVPPSPASSGVRYVPASPRVVGFDCPLTPHAYALRSPSWRSEAGIEGSSVGGHSALACCSGSSTPRRQASSPGLLQQALARSGMASQQQHHSQPQLGASGGTSTAGSGCNTPSAAGAAARRAGSTGQVANRLGPTEAAGGFAAATAAAGHGVHVTGTGADRQAGGSNGAGLFKHGSCSSTALLLTMMGGQVPVLHPHRTTSSPFLDALQSPGSARRYRSSGAAGFDPAVEAAAGPGAADAAAAAADTHPDPALASAARPPGSSGGSNRSSSDSGSSASSPPRPQAAGDALSAAADLAPAGHQSLPCTADPPCVVTPPPAPAAAAEETAAAATAAVDVTAGLSICVSSSQLAAQSSRYVSPQPPHATSPQAYAAQAPAAEAGGQHKLSRFGLAAARASSEKPLVELGSKGSEVDLADVVPQQGVTAIVMTCGQAGGSHEATAACGSTCSGSNCGSSSSSQGRGSGLVEAVSLAAGVAVVVPDTPALEATAEGAAFAAQHSVQQELPSEPEGSLAAALIEQELLLQQATTGNAAADGACTDGPGVPAASSSSSSKQQRLSWAPQGACTDGASGPGDHHPPPASPCTPQQDAEQQQLQSPDKQQGPRQHPQDIWQQLQEQQLQQQAQRSPQPLHAAPPGCQGSPRTDHSLPRCKSAAADLAGGRPAAAAAAAPRATSDAGTPDAAAAAAAGSGVWSPTHDVRGVSRHRSPSALLMRLSQRQVEVLEAKGRATSTVPYVLPHRSSNPASALRALTTSVQECSSTTDKPQHALTAPTGNTPRSSLEMYSSPGGTPGPQALQPAASWDLEQVQPPDDLLALATVPAACEAGTYIPLPTADSAAAAEAAQQRQQHLGAEGCVGVQPPGQADTRDVLLDAAIVRQRLSSTSEWLGPAPVVAASAAAAEAEAAAVVSRRRTSQGGPEGPALLQACSQDKDAGQDSSRGRVATTAAALAAAAAAAADAKGAPGRAGNSSSSSSRSRVAKAAAALAATTADAAAGMGQDPARVPAKLRPRDAWLAAAAADSAGADTDAAEACAARRPWVQQQHKQQWPAPCSGSTTRGDLAASQGVSLTAQQQQQVTTAGASGSEAAALSVGSMPADEACDSPTRDHGGPSGAPVAAEPSESAAEASSSGVVGPSPPTPADASSTGVAVAANATGLAAAASTAADAPAGSSDCADSSVARQQLQPGLVGADADASTVADAPAASSHCADSSAAHQQLQPGLVGYAADASVLPAGVRGRQQQLLHQRQAMRAQLQQRKRDEVAAWARVQRTQAQLAANTEPAAAAAGTAGAAVGAAEAADVTGRRGVDQAGAVDAAAAAAAAAADLSCCEDRPLQPTVRNGIRSTEQLPGMPSALNDWVVDDTLHTPAVAQAVDPAVASAPELLLQGGRVDLLEGPGLEGPALGLEAVGELGGLGSLRPTGLQRCDSAVVSIADDFSDVQSWAAWSTTSSINRCPRLEWWGTGAGRGRFSQRQQQRRTQAQPVGGLESGGGGQAGWWQRLLQRRQEGGGGGGGGVH